MTSLPAALVRYRTDLEAAIARDHAVRLRQRKRRRRMIVVVAEENVAAVSQVLEAEGEKVVALGRMVARAEGAAGTIYKGTLAL